MKSYTAAHRETAKKELHNILKLSPNIVLGSLDTEELAQSLVARIKSLPLTFCNIFDKKRAIKVVNDVKSGGVTSTLGDSSQKQKEIRNRASIHRLVR